MTPTPEDIALAVIGATAGLFKVAIPDPEEPHVFVWSSGAPEQLAAIIESELKPLRELAEIGRLAVEARRLYGTESGAWFTAECALGKAADAYLAKQPKL